MRAGWSYDDVDWGVSECAIRGCSEPAECLLDDEPCCLAHADLLLERAVALQLAPSLRETLPAVGE